MAIQSTYSDGPLMYLAGEALVANRRVKVKSGTVTNPPEVEYADAGELCVGITIGNQATVGGSVTVKSLNDGGSFLIEASAAIAEGAVLYGTNDGKVDDSGTGTPQFTARMAATGTGHVIECVVQPFFSTTAATVSATTVGTAQTTVQAQLSEVYADALTAKGIIQIPMPNQTVAGVALAAFSDAESPTMGFCVTSKGIGIRWNNDATPGGVAAKVMVPPDADVTADMVLHILAAKTGATAGDATKFTVGAFNNVVGALYDADSTFGGDTTAMTAAATAKTVQHVTLTLALANLAAYPASVELTFAPKSGTLGTDDVIMLAQWIEYKKKLLTA